MGVDGFVFFSLAMLLEPNFAYYSKSLPSICLYFSYFLSTRPLEKNDY